jgi:beta-glucanase (GH16 family)
VNGTPLVSALLPRIPGQTARGQTYGRYAVRFRADKLPGYKMAWLLWPDSNSNKHDGEIDFPEKDLDTPNVYGFVHYPGATDKNDQGWAQKPIDITEWHTAVIEWSPGLVVFSMDGVEIGRTVNSRVPSTPMHWVLQTEVSLTAGRPSPKVDGHVQIDWVAMWAYAPA